jgi:hypothetical protein
MMIRVGILILLAAVSLEAQIPRPEVRLAVGWTGFLDDGVENHAVAGGSVRYYFTPRLSIEPALMYMNSEGHSDFTLVPNLAFDFGQGRVVPYVIGGLGWIRSDFRRFETDDVFFSGGVGVKLFLTDRVYFAPEWRAGWEPHLSFTGTFGFVF